MVAKDSVVLIHYTLTNTSGAVLDSSDGGEPLGYLHGHSNIISGLESQLEGRAVGDKLVANVKAADGYGERDEALVQDVPRSAFPAEPVPEAGMQFQAQGPEGAQLVTVTGVTDENVTVDGNHPLAGQDLKFDVEIVEVRAASAEELQHGHVHGPGGHDHG